MSCCAGRWVNHVIQSCAHGINSAIAHLQFEAILATGPAAASAPQAGRPFVVADPGPPVYYGDVYRVISALNTTPFRLLVLPPVPMLLLAYAVEFYNLLPARFPVLSGWLPKLPGDVGYLEPGLFSICTHLFMDDGEARKGLEEGGLGYTGVVTTLEGMCQELNEWNREQAEHARELRREASVNGRSGGENGKTPAPKYFRHSVGLAEEIQRLSATSGTPAQ